MWSNARAYLFDNKYADAMRKIMLCLCLLCIGTIAKGQTSYEYVYWLDNDMASGRMSVTSGDSWQTDVDVAYLSDGLHSLHIQVRNTDSVDVWSAPVTRYFIKQTSHSEEMTYRYWFDNDNATMVVSNEELAWLDVSALDDGLHMLHVMAEGTVATQTLSYQFLKIPQTDGVDYLHCLCYLDGKLYHQERVASSGGIVHWEFDVSGLAQGIHNIQVQTVTPSGAATGLYESMFLRTTTHAEMASLKCFYTIDGAESYIEAGTYADGAFHFDLDVSTIDDGLHQLAYMLVGDNGVSTKVSSAFFMKTPLGGNGITQYWYWLNDDDANKTVVKLEERTNPYQLIGLLPVESMPIRSSLFHFEVDEEQGPMVYAKNEFHIRFYDATGRLVDATKEYVDPEVKEKVTGITALERNTKTNISKPLNNEILWFAIDASVGDHVSFSTNQSCSMELYSPLGDMVYNASDLGSVNRGGCHTWTEGVYYLAVHDVKGTNKDELVLDYMHLDRYALLEHTQVIPNYGVTAIQLLGNGFTNAASVTLHNENFKYTSEGVSAAENMSELMAFFAFGDSAALGMYDMTIRYSPTDSLVINNAVSIEKADSLVDLSISIGGNPFFLAGSTNTYTLDITNKSNRPAFNVPVRLSIRCENSEEDIYTLKFGKDFDLPMKRQLKASLEELNNPILADIMYHYIFGDDDLSMFVIQKDSVGTTWLIGDIAIPYVPGNGQYSLPFTIGKMNHNISIYASVMKHWMYDAESNVAKAGSRNRSADNDRCCVQLAVDCVFSIIEYAMPDGIPSFAKDCALGYAREVAKGVLNDVICQGESFDPSQYVKEPQSIVVNIGSAIMNCIADKLKEIGLDILTEKYLKEALGGRILKSYNVAMNCVYDPIVNWANKCGDDDGSQHNSDPLNSWDPNYIFGYTAPNGSHYISDREERIRYTIEFENDSALATAAAQRVSITDTLDSRYFDLGSFEAAGISISGTYYEIESGQQSFIKTIDLRPRMDVLVQVACVFDEHTGVANWQFTSLDPMTIEERTDTVGFLPVNDSEGRGIGQVSYSIAFKQGLPDGTRLDNRASIVFDYNDPILTPTWTNIIDNSAPTSEFLSVEELNDTVIRLRWKGGDENSPAWRYSLAVQAVEDTEWFEFLSNTTDTVFDYRYYRDIDYGFCVLATDSAGNVESREWTRKAEFMREYIAGDADRSGTVNLLDLNLTLSHILGGEVNGCDMLQMDANGDGSINVLDINAILQIILDADGEGAAQRKRDSGVIRIINTKVI